VWSSKTTWAKPLLYSPIDQDGSRSPLDPTRSITWFLVTLSSDQPMTSCYVCVLRPPQVTCDHNTKLELELLVLRYSSCYCNNLTLIALKLKLFTVCIFTARLFTYTTLDTSLAIVLYSCTQLSCNYITSLLLHRVLSISNLLKYYYKQYKGIATS